MKHLWMASAALLMGVLLLGSPERGVSTPRGSADDKKDEKKEDKAGWVSLFNGKDLTGWKMHPGNAKTDKWRVENGFIMNGGTGNGHLFSERDDYEDFHFRIEAKINDKGNSGQYFRTKFMAGYPEGYEAQINATFPTDPIRTGSLYPAFNRKLPKDIRDKLIVLEAPHKPDEWFTQEVIAIGNHIQIFVNGKKTVDYVDPNHTYKKGHFALQSHGPAKGGPECVLTVRKIEVKEIKKSDAK